MKNTILIAALSLMLGACATTGGGSQTSANDAAQAIAAAQAAREKVAKVGYEWRDTGSLLDKAKQAAEAKEYDKAAALASEAEKQSVAAMAQYEAQKNAGKSH